MEEYKLTPEHSWEDVEDHYKDDEDFQDWKTLIDDKFQLEDIPQKYLGYALKVAAETKDQVLFEHCKKLYDPHIHAITNYYLKSRNSPEYIPPLVNLPFWKLYTYKWSIIWKGLNDIAYMPHILELYLRHIKKPRLIKYFIEHAELNYMELAQGLLSLYSISEKLYPYSKKHLFKLAFQKYGNDIPYSAIYQESLPAIYLIKKYGNPFTKDQFNSFMHVREIYTSSLFIGYPSKSKYVLKEICGRVNSHQLDLMLTKWEYPNRAKYWLILIYYLQKFNKLDRLIVARNNLHRREPSPFWFVTNNKECIKCQDRNELSLNRVLSISIRKSVKLETVPYFHNILNLATSIASKFATKNLTKLALYFI